MLKGGAVWALGTMSGTSLDGVDAAMLLTDGERILDFGPTAFRPYSPTEQATIRAAPSMAGKFRFTSRSRLPGKRPSRFSS